MDVRPATTEDLYGDEAPDRVMTMWFDGEYKEVSAPTQLIYTEAVRRRRQCDRSAKHGYARRPP